MQRMTKPATIVLLLLFMIEFACAGEFDGTVPMLCVAEKGIEYHGVADPKNFAPENVGLPDKFFVNLKDRKIVPTIDSLVRRTAKIEQSRRVEDKLVLQGTDEGVEGVEDGIGWSMAISIETGEFVISVSASSVGYIEFGRCTCVE